VNAKFATRRRQFKKLKLRWRMSRGARRSLGWVPFKAAQIKRAGRCVRFAGKTLRVFEAQRLEGVVCKCGCFAQDAVGDWWLSVPVEVAVERSVARESRGRHRSGAQDHRREQRWAAARGGSVLPRPRAADRPGAAPCSSAPSQAPAPYGGAPPQ
jgi:hypothetical protein